MFQNKMYDNLYKFWGVILFITLLFSGMRYIILENVLYCKIMWIIPIGSMNIADIISVERSYNPISSSAASLKRLCIYYHKGALFPFWLISPVREQEFIEALKALNPNISVRVPIRKGIWRIWDLDI